jgi:hypothetical protein
VGLVTIIRVPQKVQIRIYTQDEHKGIQDEHKRRERVRKKEGKKTHRRGGCLKKGREG